MSVLRGRPPGLAGGIRGTSKAYCSSLKAWPAPKSPTNARLSAVHMARLREGLFPSSTVGTAASPHARPDGRASQTASQMGQWRIALEPQPPSQRVVRSSARRTGGTPVLVVPPVAIYYHVIVEVRSHLFYRE